VITNTRVAYEALCTPVILQEVSVFNISMRNAYRYPLHYDPLPYPALAFTIQEQGYDTIGLVDEV
jgi:hypothetical protein